MGSVTASHTQVPQYWCFSLVSGVSNCIRLHKLFSSIGDYRGVSNCIRLHKLFSCIDYQGSATHANCIRVHKLLSSDGDYQGSVIMSGTQVVLHYWWLSGVSDHVRYTSCTPVSVTIRLTSVIMLGTHAVLKCWWLSGVSHHVWHMYAKLCQCVSQQLKALSTEPKSTITLPDHCPPRWRCESNVCLDLEVWN